MSLPDKKSELLQVALNDIKRAANTPGYRIDMHEWHYMDPDTGVCEVCLAGAVMAFSLNVAPTEAATPSSVSKNDLERDKLRYLNALRQTADRDYETFSKSKYNLLLSSSQKDDIAMYTSPALFERYVNARINHYKNNPELDDF